MDWLLQTIEHGGITHNGMFHADDVLSTCLLRLVKPDFQYQRVDTVFKEFKGIAYDVGGGSYDHHQT